MTSFYLFCRFYIQKQLFMNHCRTKLGKTFESVQKTFYSKKGNYLIHKNVAVRIFTRPKTQRWGFNSLEENDYETWREEGR